MAIHFYQAEASVESNDGNSEIIQDISLQAEEILLEASRRKSVSKWQARLWRLPSSNMAF